MYSPSMDGQSVRRSNRIKGTKPEFEPLDDPERTPKNRRVPDRHKRTNSSSSDSSDQSESSHVNYGDIYNFESALRVPELEGRPNVNNSGQNQNEITIERKYECVRLAPLNQRRECTISINTSNSNCKLLCLLFTFVVVILAAIYFVEDPKDETFILNEQFPQQSKELWGFVSHGMHSAEPFVLLLVHADEGNLATCLAKQIAKIVADGRTKKSVDAIVIDGRDEVHRDTFVTIRPQLQDTRALVLLHVEHMAADAADFLHFVLDVHEPWVPGGVYVLTLDIPYIDVNKTNVYNDVQIFLKKKWSGVIKEDSLDALITRVGNFEYVVKKDHNPCH